MRLVYVIGNEPGPKKIGTGRDVSKRLLGIQTGSHTKLSVLWTTEIVDDAPLIERYAHWLLKDTRLSGEWFDVTLQEAISAILLAIGAVDRGEAAPRMARSMPDADSRMKPDRLRECLLLLHWTQRGLARNKSAACRSKYAAYMEENWKIKLAEYPRYAYIYLHRGDVARKRGLPR